MRFGFSEDEALNLPVDRFEVYCDSMQRIEAGERRNTVVDLVTSIGGALTGKGIKEAIREMDNIAEGTDGKG